MNIHDAYNITNPLGIDEIMERQRDAQDQKDAQMDERINEKTKEYFEDTGTFFEFIQCIEIDNDDLLFFGGLHKDLLSGDALNVTDRLTDLFMSYCQSKASIE